MLLPRREFLRQSVQWSFGLSAGLSVGLSAGLTAYGVLGPRVLRADPSLPELETPDWSESNIVAHVAGIRPFRKGCIRVEWDPAPPAGKKLFHCYGHGGGGFTLSWGSAEVVADAIEATTRQSEPIAILGAGVVGMSTARVLQERGYRVRIYAQAFSPGTTSDRAGAQWSPAAVAAGRTDSERALFGEMLARSHRRFSRMDSQRYGISRRLTYIPEGYGGSVDRVPPGILPPFEYFERLPFAGKARRGRAYWTFLMVPPVYLPALMQDLRDAGARFEQRRFAHAGELSGLQEPLIIDCLGLGAGQLFCDPQVTPIRGQLLHLKPQSLPYLLIHEGYIFPRSDVLLLGGTFEEGVSDPTPTPEGFERILRVNRDFFRVPGGID